MALDLSSIQKEKKKEAKAAPSSQGILSSEITLFGANFNDKKKEKFFSEFYLLFSSGVDLRTAFEIFISQISNKKEQEIFLEIENKTIKGGVKLWQALQQSGKFSEYEFYSVRLGEESGKLKEVFQELSEYFNRRIKQKRQFMSAISAPMMVLLASVGVLGFMLNYVVPVFADMYKKMGGELPKITRVIISVADVMKKYGLFTFILIAGIILFFYMNRKKIWFRKYSSSFVLRIPVIGNLIAKIYLARFSSSMNMLLMAYTPLERALLLVQNMVEFYPLEIALEEVRRSVIDGKGFHAGMAKFKLFPHQMLALTKIGEKVNQLGSVFGKLSKQYNDEVDKQSETVGKMVEPLLILFIGTIVGFIIVAMYLPMFKMNTLIKH